MNLFRHDVGRLLLFDEVEAAAVNHPNVLFGGFLWIRSVFGVLCFELGKPAIKPGKIIGGADPKNSSEDMDPAKNQIGPFSQVEVHGAEFRSLLKNYNNSSCGGAMGRIEIRNM